MDRFLEHSRIFYFGNDGDPQVYIGSADWMDRNLSRRVEVVFPIEPPELKQRLIREILATSLADNVKARELLPDGTYRRLPSDPSSRACAARNGSWRSPRRTPPAGPRRRRPARSRWWRPACRRRGGSANGRRSKRASGGRQPPDGQCNRCNYHQGADAPRSPTVYLFTGVGADGIVSAWSIAGGAPGATGGSA